MLYPGRRRSSSMASTHVSSSSSNSSVSSWSSVGLEDLTVVRRLGSGDIGNVYLCQLPRQTQSDDDECVLLAMKVVDMEAVALKNKLERAEMEKKILCMIDHPFLPTLYSHFQASHFSCFLIDFCPRGDLFASRLRQPSSRFSISAAKFYAAETLVALEYLHMMGIVYRDLKPENVLIREDGHIMLSDFDLCLKSDVVPKLLLGNHPLLSCFFSLKKQGRRQKEEVVVMAEPVKVRSKSMVGTHEYLAPEVISGEGHGAAVDWWTLGVFLYELLYGITPFKGRTNHDTLRNILKQHLRFPKTTMIECGKDLVDKVKAHDLISKLLVKNPKKRMGSRIGAAEIKRHPFFQDINWALIRSIPPPHTPSNSNRVFAPKLVCNKHRDNVLPYNITNTTTTTQHTHHFDYF